MGIVAEAEYLAPRTSRPLTQTNEFMSISTELLPVARSSPPGPFDSFRPQCRYTFYGDIPGSEVRPELMALIPSGYTPRFWAAASPAKVVSTPAATIHAGRATRTASRGIEAP